MSNVFEKLKKTDLLSTIYDATRQSIFKYGFSNEKLIKYKFNKRLGRDVNLENPVMYNDKLQWLKLNWEDPQAKKCADKYEVRELIRNLIGEKYLNNLYGVYSSVEEINIDTLPKSFVLKGTHGSGYNIICKDKTKLDWDKERKKMRRWLKNNYYWSNREWVYKDIKPLIICEEMLVQENNEELRDYRFFCFNGVPRFISVDFSITEKSKTRRNLYDLNWNIMDEEITYHKELEILVEKPKKLKEMIKLSEILSEGFPHVRIDFYYVNDEIRFGEMTFYHQSGMGKIRPPEFELEMGEWLVLPN